MRRLLRPLLLPSVILVAAIIAGAALRAQGAEPNVPAADRAAIRNVIDSQMAAFRRDDGEGAFAFASPTIRNIFGSAENFMNMVRGGYPQVYRPRQVEFRELVGGPDALFQLVWVVGPDGAAAIAAYEMQQQADGSWRINGVQLLKTPERNT
jgi:hypothetical protein